MDIAVENSLEFSIRKVPYLQLKFLFLIHTHPHTLYIHRSLLTLPIKNVETQFSCAN